MSKNLRQKSKKNGKPNTLQRVSINFKKYTDSINKIRELNGLDELSYPKISELMVKHKKYSKPLKKDIINYNIDLDEDDEY